MKPSFLVPEITVQANGNGPTVELNDNSRAHLLTLGIEEAVEQASLSVSIMGSVDGIEWSDSALLEWPQKFYAGSSALYLPTVRSQEVRFLRAQWKMNRWGRGSKTPSFRFYIFLEELEA